MDPASAIVGIIAFGTTVCTAVCKVRNAIKGASGQVQELRDSCIMVELLLNRLHTVKVHTIRYSPEELAYLNILFDGSRRCMKEVDDALRDVLVPVGDGIADSGEAKVCLRRWVLNKGKIGSTSRKLHSLKETLALMLEFMHS